MILPTPIDRLELQQQTDEGVRRFDARLLDAAGEPVPGLVPARLTIRDQAGRVDDIVLHACFRNGMLELAVPIAYNEPSSTFTATLQEFASGRKAEVEWPP